MSPATLNPLIAFIQSELKVSEAEIAIAFRQPLLSPSHLPIALWQFGLISLDDVSKIFDWLEARGSQCSGII